MTECDDCGIMLEGGTRCGSCERHRLDGHEPAQVYQDPDDPADPPALCHGAGPDGLQYPSRAG